MEQHGVVPKRDAVHVLHERGTMFSEKYMKG